MRNNENLITSVLGFDFDVKTTYTNENGEDVELCKGCRTIPYTGKEKAIVGSMITHNRFFTNFNNGLLTKIRDYKSKNS